MKRFLISLLAFATLGVAWATGITVRAVNSPAERVFARIMHQSGKNFVYASDLLKGVKVTIDVTDADLTTVLTQMFSSTDIDWKIRGNNIMLVRRPAPPVRMVTVSGFVRESGTGEALAGVYVSDPSSRSVTATKAMGFYSLSLPMKSGLRLKATYPGYIEALTGSLQPKGNLTVDIEMVPDGKLLQEVQVLGSRNHTIAMESSSIGSLNVGTDHILRTPVILGEKDVIKTLQLEPGVSAGIEGMAGMYVHGGNTDENLYMLDNIPLYQVNHLGGMFSAFNTEAMRNVDFYKSSFPAKYDGRLSSYIDVHTKDGSMEAHHGSVKLGLTSGEFNIDGPIWKDHTSYSVALRRSWLDILSIPICAVANKFVKYEKYSVGYAFSDLNAKITHRFSPRSRAYAMLYYGDDYLRITQSFDKDKLNADYDEEKTRMRWGNLVASAGWNYVISPRIFMELTGAYSRYSSRLLRSEETGNITDGKRTTFTIDKVISDNNINDWIVKADFDYRPHQAHTINFGAGYTRHSFLPSRTSRHLATETLETQVDDRVTAYSADEFNAYFGGDWRPLSQLRIGYGLHGSLFRIDGRTHHGLSPRLSARWTPAEGWAVKAGYSRTVQYVHQLIQSSISLPTDQWVPVIGSQKPQTADKIAAGVYWSDNRGYTISVEGFWKWMRNLIEYADDYYLLPPETAWSGKMTTGTGTAKGIDFKISKEFGKITGQLSYSLLWADRCYPGRNGGRPFPARFDNRHKINIMANWRINSKWELTAAWTGMSGNRYTLATQCWYDPSLAPWHYEMLLRTDVNNYRLPFYHRLDLSCRRNTRHGYWDFSLYNAYCNMNTIAVTREYRDELVDGQWQLIPTFQKIKLIPVIPSVSYTWLF